MKLWHKSDLLNRMYINIDGGKKAAMPRYYKNKIYTDEQRKEIAGYQKGEIENRLLKNMSKVSHSVWDEETRNKNQAIKAAFDRMEYLSRSRQKL